MQEVKIYTTNSCPYCVQAKRLLASENIAYQEINLEGQPDLRQRISEENGGYRTVPMIFIGTKFIGGFNDLALLRSSNELRSLVNS
jgi:glutaredoxin 3